MNSKPSDQQVLKKSQSQSDIIQLQDREHIERLKQGAPEFFQQHKSNPGYIVHLLNDITSIETLPLIPDQEPETPYPTEALLGMADAVHTIASKTSMPPALVGQCALGVVNAITQGLVNVLNPASPKPEPTSLYLLTGADSGEGKSWGEKIISFQINDKATASDLAYMSKHHEYEQAKKAYQGQQETIKKDRNLSQADRERQLQELKKPQMPMNPRYRISDTTLPGVARQFHTGCTRLSIMTDEGGVFWGGFALVNNQRTGVMGAFNSMWSDGSWEFDRGSVDNSYRLIGRRVAISMSVQTNILQEVMLDEAAMEQGFLARHLIAAPDSRIADRTMIKKDWSKEVSVVEFWNKLNRIYDITPRTRANFPLVLEPKPLMLSEDAEKIYMEFGNKCLGRYQEKKYQLIKPMLGKAEAQLRRIAATLTCFNDPSDEIITADTIEAATYLMDYYLKEAVRITGACQYSADVHNSHLAQAVELLEWLKSTGGYVTYSSYMTQHAPHKSRRKDTIEKLMKILVDHGHAYQMPQGTIVDGKERKQVWLIIS